LVHDIETIPESEIAGDWIPSESDKERYPDRDPFPPIWAHKVICIGMLSLDKDLMPLHSGCAKGGLDGGATEKEMIERWSEVVTRDGAPARLVDYNGRRFDVPVLQTRAYRYGIQIPWYFEKGLDNYGKVSKWSKEYRDRYGGNHVDLQEEWTNKGSFRYPHLDNLAKLMGLPGKCGFDGSQVHGAYKDKRYKEIDVYCMEDVFQTAFVFMRMQYTFGRMGIERYRKVAGALLEVIESKPDHKEFFENIDRAAVLLE